MPHTLVSIALCTYNSGNYLSLLLESLLVQTYENIEIICCDDKSTDNTQLTLLAYQTKYPEIIRLHFNETNIGYTKNFEQCLLFCNGDFIAIADHDDIWMKAKIEKLLAKIGEAMLIYSDSIYIDKEGREIGRQLTTKFNLHNRPDPRSFVFASSVWGHTVLLKKELLKIVLPAPGGAPYDTWLAYTAASISEVRYLPEPLTYWRQHSASFSATHYAGKEKDKNLKFNDWKEVMNWIRAMKDFPDTRHLIFLQELYRLYKKKEKSFFVWGLYFFLIRNKKVLFKVWRRSYISSLNEFRKMSSGVKKYPEKDVI